MFASTARRTLYAALLIPCIIAPIHGRADSGTVETVASFVVNNRKVEFGDVIVTGGGASGTITVVKSSGDPFVEDASGLIQCIVLAKKSAAGLDLEADCPAAFSPEDKIFYLSKRRSGDLVPGTGGEGATQIMGGTGKFAGITGACKYKSQYLEDRNVTISRCEWRRP